VRYLTVLLLLVQLGLAQDEAKEKEVPAFDFKNPKVKTAIDTKEIIKGNPAWQGDPRDKIPAIDNPKATAAKDADWVRDKERVLGIVVNGEARAYPLRVLMTHEMVNDVVGGQPVGPNY